MAERVKLPAFPAARCLDALRAVLDATVGHSPAREPRELPLGSELAAEMATMARDAGFSAELVELSAEELDVLFGSGTAAVLLPVPGATAVAYAGRRGRRHAFVDASGQVRLTTRREATDALTRAARERFHAVAKRFSAAGANARAARAVEHELGGALPVALAFVLRRRIGGTTSDAVRSARPLTEAVRVVALASTQSLLGLVAWAILGTLALDGHVDRARLLGWALVSLTGTLLQVTLTAAVARFGLRASSALRERMLEGALALDPDALSSLGLGGVMVIAGQTEGFLGAAIGASIALLGLATNMAATVGVLAATPAPAFALALFAVGTTLVLAHTPSLVRGLAAQQVERTRLTTDTVERMVGHTTRLVQQTPNTWHDGEDARVHAYARASARVDGLTLRLGVLPRAYHVVAAFGLVPVLVAAPTISTLALALGGATLGMASLAALGDFLATSAGLLVLWREIRGILGGRAHGAQRAHASGQAISREPAVEGEPILELREVTFAYEGAARPVLEDASLVLRSGDRVLVEGPSGGGKSTLAGLLSGARAPTAGLLRAMGLDQHTLAEGELRRVVASAPQFYKNHVFAASLAENLLLSRPWPPTREDLADAAEVCEAVGLGPLVARMPSGLFQHVGETGWQLSHGEKSRVYLARTLLQRAEVVLLDETFGALDPDTLTRCMDVARARAKTLVVVTHR